MAKIFQARNVCFTSYHADPPKWSSTKMTYLVYQQEVCPKTGRDHWQGFVQFNNPMRMKGIKEALGLPDAHLEPMGGTPKQAADYCKKEESRKPGGLHGEYGQIRDQGKRMDLMEVKRKIFEDNYTRAMLMMEADGLAVLARYPKLVDELIAERDRARNEAKLAAQLDAKMEVGKFPWQEELARIVEEKVDERDDRAVYWVWENRGNAGKSFWASVMATKAGAVVIAPDSCREMAYVWSQKQSELVIIDVARTMERDEKWDPLRGAFQFVEQLKNGRVLSTKYQSRVVLFPSPMVVFLSNFAPNKKFLSEDRWMIYKINNKLRLSKIESDKPENVCVDMTQ